MDCFREAIKIYSNQSNTNNIEIAHTLLDVAFAFHEQGNYEKVLICTTSIIPALETERAELDYHLTLGKCVGLKAIAHYELNELDNALKSYDLSIKCFDQHLNSIPTSDSKGTKETYIFLASTRARKARVHERLCQDSTAIRQYSCKSSFLKFL